MGGYYFSAHINGDLTNTLQINLAFHHAYAKICTVSSISLLKINSTPPPGVVRCHLNRIFFPSKDSIASANYGVETSSCSSDYSFKCNFEMKKESRIN